MISQHNVTAVLLHERDRAENIEALKTVLDMIEVELDTPSKDGARTHTLIVARARLFNLMVAMGA